MSTTAPVPSTATVEVTLTVEVDLDAWCTEYGLADPAAALADATVDLGEQGWYLQDYKWQGLARVRALAVKVAAGAGEPGPA
jgi:hypothetical protein